MIEDIVRTIWGKDFLTVSPPPILSGVVPIFGATFPVYRLFVIAVALVVAAVLAIWLRSSRVGLYVRASSVDPVTTGMQGVDTDWLSALVVAIGTGLAGLPARSPGRCLRCRPRWAASSSSIVSLSL